MLDKEARSELSSSIHKGAGYDEVYPSWRELKECFPRSLEWEPSTHLLSEKEENKEDEEGYEENDEGDVSKEDKEDGGNQSEGVESVG